MKAAGFPLSRNPKSFMEPFFKVTLDIPYRTVFGHPGASGKRNSASGVWGFRV